MKYRIASSLLLGSSHAIWTRLIDDDSYTVDLKSWAWDGQIHLESTLTKKRGAFVVEYDIPIVEQVILITTDTIAESELATLDLMNDIDKFTMFDRIKWTYETQFGITYMVDECKNFGFENGELQSGADCPWQVIPYGHRILAGAFDYKAVAHRPSNGTPNTLLTS